ncbi:BrnA antitoxin family protein [Stenotrophomonas maltophilia]|nr:BrnA antitoxin family protein [Stenotrophomonas maltophilia]
MNTHMIDQTINTAWDDGEYGRSEDHVAVAPQNVQDEFNRAMAMKLVSIRLPVPLIEGLKMIAEHHGIAYQPMIRDLLSRFAASEVKEIMADLQAKMRAARDEEESSPPVDSFMQKKVACGGM